MPIRVYEHVRPLAAGQPGRLFPAVDMDGPLVQPLQILVRLIHGKVAFAHRQYILRKAVRPDRNAVAHGLKRAPAAQHFRLPDAARICGEPSGARARQLINP